MTVVFLILMHDFEKQAAEILALYLFFFLLQSHEGFSSTIFNALLEKLSYKIITTSYDHET